MKMKFIFNSFLFLFFMVSCSQKKPESISNLGVGREITQIYFILDKNDECSFPFLSNLRADEIEKKLGARVFVHREDRPNSEIITQTNSRNPQIIVLGSGWPQELWKKINPPTYPQRHLLGVGAKGPWTSLLLDWDLMGDFVSKACIRFSKQTSCEIVPNHCSNKFKLKPKVQDGLSILSLDSLNLNSLFIANMKWEQILDDVLRDRQSPNPTIQINIKSGYLGINVSPNHEVENQEARNFLKNWLLKNL